MITILGAAAAAGPALAQPGLTAVGHGAAGQVALQKPARVAPVSLAARQAIAAAPFEKPAPRKLDLTVRADDRLRDEVELRQKDAWNEDEGFQFRMTKVAYTRRF
ncbi:hypothetical protein LRS10_18855 [Phenylobacterium sp. J426]|uniref:hypothetical protein n=1 Tax=Phenylobacterium sp. J426 TaxID=2898439 RepID=UPI0021519582|nr:hypothetical protein [Phenylobacterium sp. J426]MCR5876021.1 hypothetical protein [Phenylobacterium sp. J426]